jgi:hypothetical protein
VLHKRSDVLPALVVANIREIAMSRSTGLMRPRYESVFTHSGPTADIRSPKCLAAQRMVKDHKNQF